MLLKQLLVLNIVLFFFNLIPVPPLDGSSVLAWVLPDRLQVIPQTLRRYGMIVFLILLISPALGFIMRPVYLLAGMWARWLLGLVGA